MTGFNFHSAVSLNTLDRLSAIIFLQPAICDNEIQILLSIHHNHISLEIELQILELLPPISFKYQTVVALSDSILM